MGRIKESLKRAFHLGSKSSSLQLTPSPATASATALQSTSSQASGSTPRPLSAAGKLQTPPHIPSLLGNNTVHTQIPAPPPPTAQPIAGQNGKSQSVVGHGFLPLPGSVPSITVNGPPAPPQTAQPGGINTPSLNQVATSNNPPIAPLAVTQVPSLWKQAFDKLSKSDAKVFISTDSNKEGFSQELLDAITAQRDICQENRWKFKFRGQEIIVRDLADKLLDWVDKFKNIGNVVASYDPSHAALPWAGIRFVLQIVLTDREAMGVIMVGIERIAGLLVRSLVHEELYLRSKVTITGRTRLEASFVELYHSILQFLACAKQQLGRPTTTRILRTILDMEGGKSLFEAIEEKEKLLETELRTANREIRMHKYGVVEDQHNEIIAFLRSLGNPISRIDLGLASMYSEIKRFNIKQDKLQILQWICNARYIEHHNQAKENLLDNTGQWLINRPEFRDWQNSSASGILWLRGMPGAGKTKLTCMVIDHLASSRRPYEPVVYFYCNRNESERRTPEVVMRAIVKQLSVVLPTDDQLPNVVVQEYNGREKGGLADGALRLSECEKLIVSLLDIHPQTTIIIDALDEVYQEKRWILISSLRKIMVQSPSLVKVFVSSRDYHDIKLRLEDVPNMYIEATDNGDDITRYVRREVESATDNRLLLAGKASEPLKVLIISTIERHANGMFQWADLQIKQLYHLRFEHQVIERLGKMPKTLEETYFEIWREICGETEMQDITKRALMWVMCSIKRLSKSLWVQLSYRSITVELDDFEHLIDSCRNLVVWDKQLNKPIFSHLSVREFLEGKIFTERKAHTMAAYTCISYLSKTESPKSWSGRYEEDARSSEAKRLNIYVRSFWPDHVDESFNEESPIDPSLLRLLNHFLSPGSDYETRAYPRSGDRFPYRHANEERHKDSIRSKLLRDIRDPLFIMSFFQFGEEMECLWKKETLDVNMRNSNGVSLLEGVCTRRSRWILDFLLQKGVDLHLAQGHDWEQNEQDQYDDDQYMNYQHNSRYTVVKHTQPEAIIKLLENGAFHQIHLWNLEDTRINVLQDLVESSGHDVGCLKRVLSWNRSISIQNEQITRCGKSGDKTNSKYQGRHPLNICGYFRMAKDVLLAAFRSENALDILDLLFSHYPRLKINTRLLLQDIQELKNIKLIQFLFDRNAGLQVTEAMLVAAAGSEMDGLEIMQLLIDRDAGLQVTEAVLVAAVSNLEQGLEIMQFLIYRDAGLQVTEALLVAAAGNEIGGLEIMQLLIDRDAGLQVTEAVLVAAAGNEMDGLEIMQLLIDRDAGLQVTEAMLIAAVSNLGQGLEVMQLLIDRDAGLQVTEAVQVSESIIPAAAGNKHGQPILQLIFDRQPSLNPTQSTLIAVLSWDSNASLETLNFFFDRDPTLMVTEPMMVAAASKKLNIDVFICFFRHDPSLKVTEPTLLAVASNKDGDDTMELLFNYGAVLQVSKAIILVAAEVWSGCFTLPMFTLLQHCEDLEFTESELKMLRSSPYKETIEEFLEIGEEDGCNPGY